MAQSTGCTQKGQLTYGSVVIFTKTSIHRSLLPSMPACLPPGLPAGRPADRPTHLPIPTVPTYLYLQYPPSQFHRDLPMLYVVIFTQNLHPSLLPSLLLSLPACPPAGRPTDRHTSTVPTYLLNFIESFLCSEIL